MAGADLRNCLSCRSGVVGLLHTSTSTSTSILPLRFFSSCCAEPIPGWLPTMSTGMWVPEVVIIISFLHFSLPESLSPPTLPRTSRTGPVSESTPHMRQSRASDDRMGSFSSGANKTPRAGYTLWRTFLDSLSLYFLYFLFLTCEAVARGYYCKLAERVSGLCERERVLPPEIAPGLHMYLSKYIRPGLTGDRISLSSMLSVTPRARALATLGIR